MKKLIFILMYLFVVNALVAQCLSKSLQEYHRLCSEAENRIVVSNYDSALSIYKRAFQKDINHVFSIDIYNAFACATLLGKTDSAYIYLSLLLERGFSFEKAPKRAKKIIEILKKQGQKKFRLFKSEVYPIALNLYETHIDKEYRDFIIKLEKLDQEYRLKPGSYSKYKKEIICQDSLICIEFVKCIQNKGFPTEEKIGINGDFSIPNYHVVLHHHAQQYSKNRTVELFSGILFEALNKGEILPAEYISYIDLLNDSKRPNFGTFYGLVRFSNRKGWQKHDLLSEKQQQIDLNRFNVGVDSIDSYRKKLFFNLKDNAYFYFRQYFTYIRLGNSKVTSNILSRTSKYKPTYDSGH